MAEDGYTHELPAEVRVQVEERYQHGRTEGEHPGGLKPEATRSLHSIPIFERPNSSVFKQESDLQA
jgi:hypothetical protein